MEIALRDCINQQILLPGHFDVQVVLEDIRPLGLDGSGGYECRVRLPDSSLEETVVTAEEIASFLETCPVQAKAVSPVDAEKLRLLVESDRVRLAYTHDQQFAFMSREHPPKALILPGCATPWKNRWTRRISNVAEEKEWIEDIDLEPH